MCFCAIINNFKTKPGFYLHMYLNFSGKRAFIAGVADDNGYGWAIAKALAAAGAEILVGTWVPVCISDLTIFWQ